MKLFAKYPGKTRVCHVWSDEAKPWYVVLATPCIMDDFGDSIRCNKPMMRWARKRASWRYRSHGVMA